MTSKRFIDVTVPLAASRRRVFPNPARRYHQIFREVPRASLSHERQQVVVNRLPRLIQVDCADADLVALVHVRSREGSLNGRVQEASPRSSTRWREGSPDKRLAGTGERLHPRHDSFHQVAAYAVLLEVLLESGALKFRTQRQKSESAAQRVIDHCQRAVGGVHGTDEVEVLRNVELVIRVSRVCEWNREFASSLVGLDKHHQLTENLAQVAHTWASCESFGRRRGATSPSRSKRQHLFVLAQYAVALTFWREPLDHLSVAVVVDAKDERAAEFYEKFGFRRFTDPSLRLYLMMSTIAAAPTARRYVSATRAAS